MEKNKTMWIDGEYTEAKCFKCGRLLARINLQNGEVQIKCRCKTINTFVANVSAYQNMRANAEKNNIMGVST